MGRGFPICWGLAKLHEIFEQTLGAVVHRQVTDALGDCLERLKLLEAGA